MFENFIGKYSGFWLNPPLLLPLQFLSYSSLTFFPLLPVFFLFLNLVTPLLLPVYAWVWGHLTEHGWSLRVCIPNENWLPHFQKGAVTSSYSERSQTLRPSHPCWDFVWLEFTQLLWFPVWNSLVMPRKTLFCCNHPLPLVLWSFCFLFFDDLWVLGGGGG